jgi:3',5'-cyclic AMP phosphodiesterase CpdA
MKVIAHLSDPHFGTEDPAVEAALLGELDGTNGPRITLAAISGDLTQRAKPSQFRAARAFLDRLHCPYLVVPGNHDVPLYNLFARLSDPLGRYRDVITKDLAPTFTDDTLAVAGIATAHGLTIQDGRITREQIDDARAYFADARSQWKIVVAHHPFHGPDIAESDLSDGAGAALAAFRSAGVHLILTGHLHVAYNGESAMRDEEHRIISVHAGTCMSRRTRGEPNNYNRITFDGNEVTIQLRAWDGTKFVDDHAKTYQRSTATRELRKVH